MAPFKKRLDQNSLLYFFSIGLLFFCLFLLIHPTALYRVVPVPIEGLNPVGLITKLNGRADRKLLYDSLWIPQTEASVIYQDDLIFTFEESQIELTFSQDLKIVLQPNSLVRIQVLNGKPVVDVKMGKAEILPPSIPQDILSEKSLKQQEVTATKEKSSASVPHEKTVSEKTPENSISEIKKSVSSFKPFPEEGTLFLVSQGGLLKISPQTECKSSCSLILRLNGSIIAETKSTAGKKIEMEFHLNSKTQGVFEWTYLDGTTEHHFTFTAETLNPQNMKKALQEKRKLEVF